MAVKLVDQSWAQLSSPEAWEGPSLRVVDFADNLPVRLVTTALKRLWLVNPSKGDEQALPSASELEQEFRFALQVNSNYITGASPGRAWDDALWCRRTRYRLLQDAARPQDETPPPVLYAWRSHISNTYGHVFWDFYQSLKLEASHIGKFAPETSDVVALWHIEPPVDHASALVKTVFERDTFLYPVWLLLNVSLTVIVDEQRHSWVADGNPWTAGIWVRHGTEITVAFTSESGVPLGRQDLVAVLAKGQCEPRQVLKPMVSIHSRSLNPPELATEAVHLARAVWLYAGDTTDDCTHDSIFENGEAGTIDYSESQVLPADYGGSHEKLYETLPNGHTIRLLELEHAAKGHDLVTRLTLVDLRDAPQYEALSYTWGDPNDKVQLYCSASSVPIPSNLRDALHQLRFSDRPRYLWADAVCINQADLDERGQQVSIMRNIFHGASRVIVWLGTDPLQDAPVAFKAICYIVRSWRPPGDKYQYSTYTDAFEPLDKGARQYLHRAVDRRSWKALGRLFGSNYFRRFWIIQELSLSQSAVVFWGEHHIAWPLVGICATWLLSKGWDFEIGAPLSSAYNAFLIYVLPLAKHSAITHFSRIDLSAMLGITVGIFDSTDPRDRIYALLGMPFSGNDPEQGTLLKPNYAQDIRSVYTQAVQRILRQDEHLRVLSSIHHGAEIDTSWPTWVPKWNESYKAEPLALREEQGYYSNAGELFIPDDNTFSPDGERIYLNGIECATVTEVGNVMTKHKHGIAAMSREKDAKALMSILHTLSNEDNQLRSSWSSKVEQYTIFGFSDPVRQGEIAKEGFKSAAAVGMPGKYGIRASVEILTGHKAQVDHLVEFLAYWRERSTWNQTELLHGSVDEAWGADKESAFSKEIWLCSLNTCWGRRVFHCADGKFGLGPAATKIGDRIVVLFGGIVPFVLRPADNGAWLFVGECFVPGLMQGESVEAAGLLEHGSFEREDGALRLKLERESDTSPRFRRKVGENNIVRFEIR